MKAVLLVGGEGSRLRPLTYKRPKALVPVVNRPFLEHCLEYLKGFGIAEAVLATGHLYQLIEACLGDGTACGVKLTYSVETSPLGSAGALKLAAPYLQDTFLVVNGDIFTELDLSAFLAFHRERGALITIAITPVPDPSAFGAVVADGRGQITQFVEKPPPGTAPSNYINAGLYIMEPKLLEAIPPTVPSALERGLFPTLAQRGEAIFAFPFSDFWIDVGTLSNYLALHRHLAGGRVVTGEGTVVEVGASLIAPAVLGPGCYVEAGATVEEAVLWEGVRVGRGAVVRQAIIASHCTLPPGCHIEEAALGEGESPPQATPLSLAGSRR